MGFDQTSQISTYLSKPITLASLPMLPGLSLSSHLWRTRESHCLLSSSHIQWVSVEHHLCSLFWTLGNSDLLPWLLSLEISLVLEVTDRAVHQSWCMFFLTSSNNESGTPPQPMMVDETKASVFHLCTWGYHVHPSWLKTLPWRRWSRDQTDVPYSFWACSTETSDSDTSWRFL